MSENVTALLAKMPIDPHRMVDAALMMAARKTKPPMDPPETEEEKAAYFASLTDAAVDLLAVIRWSGGDVVALLEKRLREVVDASR